MMMRVVGIAMLLGGFFIASQIPVFAETQKVVTYQNEYGGKTIEKVFSPGDKYYKKGVKREEDYFNARGKITKKVFFYLAKSVASHVMGLYKAIVFFDSNGKKNKNEEFLTDKAAAVKGFDRTVVYFYDNGFRKMEFYMGDKLIKTVTENRANSEERLATDPYTGCKVYFSRKEKPGTGVIWKGACTADNYATGDGTLYWTAQGKVIYIAHFKKRGGLYMDHGKMQLNVPDDAFTYTVDSNPQYGPRCSMLRAVVNRDVDLAWRWVSNALADKLVERYKAACASEWEKKGQALIDFFYPGDENKGWPGIDAHVVVYRNGKKDYGERYGRSHVDVAEQNEVYWANQKIDEMARQMRAQRQQWLQQQHQRALDQEVQSFADKYGATGGWVNWNQLSANPFSYEGKVLVFSADFKRMITATSGIFSPLNGEKVVVFTDIPRNAFTQPCRVLLAGKVLGTTNINNAFGGEVAVPHVRFLGHIDCRDYDCGGYFKGHLRRH